MLAYVTHLKWFSNYFYNKRRKGGSSVLDNGWTYHTVICLWDVHTFH